MFSTSETCPLRNNAERYVNMLGVAGNFVRSTLIAFLLKIRSIYSYCSYRFGWKKKKKKKKKKKTTNQYTKQTDPQSVAMCTHRNCGIGDRQENLVCGGLLINFYLSKPAPAPMR